MNIYRQGDVLVVEMREIPFTAKIIEKDKGRVILAYGKVTGHCHAIHNRATMFRADEGIGTWLQVADGGADLVHEEHSTIALPPGNYQVVIQREYSPEAIRNVQD